MFTTRPGDWKLFLLMTLTVAGCQTPPARPFAEGMTEQSRSAIAQNNQDVGNRMAGLRQELETGASPRETAREKAVTTDLATTLDPFVDQEASGNLAQRLQDEATVLTRQQQATRDGLEKRLATPGKSMAVAPVFNPLDEVLVSLEMDNTDIRHLLKALAKEMNLNLLIHPDLLANPRAVSVSFDKAPLSMVLNEITRLTDVHSQIKGNLLRVDPHQEMVIHLGFLETDMQSDFNTGGDVLGSVKTSSNSSGNNGGGGNRGGGGGGSDNSSESIKGNFRVTGKSPSGSNPYIQIQGLLEKLLLEGETYDLNRQTGTLFLKARPSVVRIINDLMEKYKATLNRQILIEARIMEVRLFDSFQTGIDWNLLGREVSVARGMTQAFDGVTTAVAGAATSFVDPGRRILTIGGSGPTNPNALSVAHSNRSGDNFILSLLKGYGDVSVVSNPTIRAKHGLPSIITVGTANSYVKDTTTTFVGTAGTTLVPTTSINTDTVFSGLMVGVVPFINDDGKITLSVHPIKSDVDLTNRVGTDTVTLTLPRVDLKEISTVLDLQNGDTVLLGGLIDKNKGLNRTGVPVLSDLPLLGTLFTNVNDSGQVNEMVIMLHVTVI